MWHRYIYYAVVVLETRVGGVFTQYCILFFKICVCRILFLLIWCLGHFLLEFSSIIIKLKFVQTKQFTAALHYLKSGSHGNKYFRGSGIYFIFTSVGIACLSCSSKNQQQWIIFMNLSYFFMIHCGSFCSCMWKVFTTALATSCWLWLQAKHNFRMRFI